MNNNLCLMKAVQGSIALTDLDKRPYRTNSAVPETISVILKGMTDASATVTLS